MLKVSTKTGDTGKTSLITGDRVSKADMVFEVIGTLDELNSWLGLVVAEMGSQFTEHSKYLQEVQDTLFYVGAELAGSKTAVLKQTAVTKIEQNSDELQKSMADDWHTKFLLPGGTVLGAHLDIARTVCRRAERLVVAYDKASTVPPTIFKYVNRLSDHLYILRCFVNHQLEYQEIEFESRK